MSFMGMEDIVNGFHRGRTVLGVLGGMELGHWNGVHGLEIESLYSGLLS